MYNMSKMVGVIWENHCIFIKMTSFHLPVNFTWAVFHTILFYDYKLECMNLFFALLFFYMLLANFLYFSVKIDYFGEFHVFSKNEKWPLLVITKFCNAISKLSIVL